MPGPRKVAKNNPSPPKIEFLSYFPQATREVIIPKAGGGERRLGIPILLDRIAQQVVVDIIEPLAEKEFISSFFWYQAVE